MLALEEGDLQFKYWRPFVLFLCKLNEADGYQPQRGMINMIAQVMRKGKGPLRCVLLLAAPRRASRHRCRRMNRAGLALVNGVLVSDQVTPELAKRAKRARRLLRTTLRQRGVEGFADVIVAPSLVAGQQLLVQAKGFGYFRPNTVALGWPRENRDAEAYASVVEEATAFGKTVLVCTGSEDFPPSGEPLAGRVDVWMIFDLFPAAGLLLLLPFILMKDPVWRRCVSWCRAEAAPRRASASKWLHSLASASN